MQTGYVRNVAACAAISFAVLAFYPAESLAGYRDDPSAPISASWSAGGDRSSQDFSGESRSSRYRHLIASHARRHGVPVALARAVVRIESNYNPRARGRAGEIGLMQIKPQTARGIGFSGKASALYDPDTNLQWGMSYLGTAYKLANGDLCGTIMRYNGGHYAKRMTKTSRSYCRRVRALMGREGAQS